MTIINLLISVGSAVATLLGVTADTLSLSSATHWDTLGNDHPLYSTDAASPTIDITATKETFRLFVLQPNEIGETVDDKPITLEGKAYESDSPGNFRELWSYKITYTYDDITLGTSSKNKLFAFGSVKHIVGPHPGDIKEGPALKVDNLLVAPEVCGTFTCPTPNPPINISADGLLSTGTHPASHIDIITKDTLSAKVMTPNVFNWYNWDHEIKAVHSVPGPLPILGAAAAFGYSRKLRKRLKASKPKVISTTAA
jgi:hypothetical protein